MADDSSDFYSGLVAELYEPLAGDMADWQPVAQFVEKHGTPALELACGAGYPMLELISQGLEVQGIDSSADMLELCNRKAADRGLAVTVHCQLMQDLDLPDQFACCYLAGASFSLLDRLADAQTTLERVFSHLKPGGAFLLSVFRPELTPQPSAEKVRTADDGSRISVQSIGQQEFAAEQLIVTRLRYSRTRPGHDQEVVEQDWRTRWYQRDQLLEMLRKAGFKANTARGFDGKPADADCCDFSVIARKLG